MSSVILPAVLVSLLLGVGAQRCNGPENTQAATAYTRRGLFGKYYPDLKFRNGIPAQWPLPFDGLHYERVDQQPKIDTNRTTIPLTDFGLTAAAVTTGTTIFRTRFVVQWTGKLVIPCDGTYTFRVRSDDGVRVLVGGESYLDDWTNHFIKETVGKSLSLKGGSLLPISITYFQNVGSAFFALDWDTPGAGTWEEIPSTYLLPSVKASLVAKPNVLQLTSDSGAQTTCIRLSEPPLRPVTVDISNSAASDLFGFDRCRLKFTPANWDQEQCLRVAVRQLALSARRVDGVVSLFLNASSEQPEYNVIGTLQSLNPGYLTGVQPAMCSSWGDPHYQTFDSAQMTFLYSGMYTLVRDCSGDFSIQTFLSPCDATTAASCNTHVYIKYKGSTYVTYINNASSLAREAPTSGLLSGEFQGISLLSSNPNQITWETPSAKIDLKVEIFGAWRYFNIYVIVGSALQNKVVGLCGNYNGSGADDDTSSIQLDERWAVDPSEQIALGKAANIKPLPLAICGSGINQTAAAAVLPLPVNFTFDPVCSGGIATTSQLIPAPITPPPVPATPPPSTRPIEPPQPTQAMIDACRSLINSQNCPFIKPEQLSFYETSCVADSALAGRVAGLDFPDAIVILEPIRKLCNFTRNIIGCANCSRTQACVEGLCVDVQSVCGPGCANGGTCLRGGCQCAGGFTGDYCTSPPADYDPCTSLPCRNGATCTRLSVIKYTCRCPPGFYGDNCENDIDECTQRTHNCHRNAACANTMGSFSCACQPPFAGNGVACATTQGSVTGTIWLDANDNGKQDPTEAGIANVTLTIRSARGGSITKATTDPTGRYGFVGLIPGSYLVSVDVNTLPTSIRRQTQDRDVRFDSQTLVDVTQDASVSDANFGYANNDLCATLRCHSLAICDGGACDCLPGYVGDGVTSCLDQNECTDGSHPCDSHATCNNTIGSFTCTCVTGYTVAPDSGQCEDGNECASKTHNCAAGTTCKNTDGSFMCTCPEKYTGNGVTCSPLPAGISGRIFYDVDADGVLKPTDQPAAGVVLRLRDSKGQFKGSVRTTDAGAYSFLNASPGNYTVSVDFTSANPGFQSYSSTAAVRTEGLAIVLAPAQSLANADIGLGDIDECKILANGKGRCPDVAVCANTLGSFKCTCQVGYAEGAVGACVPLRGRVGGRAFIDSNVNGVPDGSDQGLTGVVIVLKTSAGSVRAMTTSTGEFTFDSVPVGNYTIQVDPSTLPPSFTVATYSSAIVSAVHRPGENVTDVFFGYGDTDECAEKSASNAPRCGPGSTCKNTQGSFECACTSGYVLQAYGMCGDVDECRDVRFVDMCRGSQVCTNTLGSFECRCPPSVPGRNYYAEANDPCVSRVGQVSGFVLLDPAGSGIKAPGMVGVPDMIVRAFSQTGLEMARNTTRADGSYSLNQLVIGQMATLLVDLPAGYAHSFDYDRIADGKTVVMASSLNNINFGLKDIDECATSRSRCGYQEASIVCANTVGSFTCKCAPGYVGNVAICTSTPVTTTTTTAVTTTTTATSLLPTAAPRPAASPVPVHMPAPVPIPAPVPTPGPSPSGRIRLPILLGNRTAGELVIASSGLDAVFNVQASLAMRLKVRTIHAALACTVNGIPVRAGVPTFTRFGTVTDVRNVGPTTSPAGIIKARRQAVAAPQFISLGLNQAVPQVLPNMVTGSPMSQSPAGTAGLQTIQSVQAGIQQSPVVANQLPAVVPSQGQSSSTVSYVGTIQVNVNKSAHTFRIRVSDLKCQGQIVGVFRVGFSNGRAGSVCGKVVDGPAGQSCESKFPTYAPLSYFSYAI